MSTVRVVPTPRGSGLVQVTLVITLAQRGQASASASTSNSCSRVIPRSTLLLNRYGAVSVKLTSTRSQGNILDMGTPFEPGVAWSASRLAMRTAGDYQRKSSQHGAGRFRGSERLESPMRHKRSRGLTVGLGAAVGAFPAAAMMSAATAPTTTAPSSPTFKPRKPPPRPLSQPRPRISATAIRRMVSHSFSSVWTTIWWASRTTSKWEQWMCSRAQRSSRGTPLGCGGFAVRHH
jgi:hypothetical protein